MRQNCDTSGTRPEARGGCETALRLTQTALFRKMAEIGRRDKPAGVPHRTSHKNSGNPAPAFPPAGFSVVGVGASAGGLAALERFFQALPPGPGLAFVVIQHLSPDYKSMMASILSKYTPMAVAEGEEGMAIAPNHVYLIPPGKTMTVEKGRLHLTAKSTQRGLHLPIDAFFSSLAREYGERAIAVVLSGIGSDGSRGIRAIKEADGLVLVQEPKSAEFDGMPSAAAATGLADFVLAPEAMPEVILNYARRLPLAPTPPLGPEGGQASADATLDTVLAILQEHAGVDFRQYKPSAVVRRIHRRLAINKCESLNEYVRLLEASDAEKSALYRDLLIGVTRFFRDPDAFEALQKKVLIPLLEAGRDPVRV